MSVDSIERDGESYENDRTRDIAAVLNNVRNSNSVIVTSQESGYGKTTFGHLLDHYMNNNVSMRGIPRSSVFVPNLVTDPDFEGRLAVIREAQLTDALIIVDDAIPFFYKKLEKYLPSRQKRIYIMKSEDVTAEPVNKYASDEERLHSTFVQELIDETVPVYWLPDYRL